MRPPAPPARCSSARGWRPGWWGERSATPCWAAACTTSTSPLDADAEGPARALADAVGGPVFALSETFGAWRVLDRRRGVTYDLTPLQGEDIQADLRPARADAQRDGPARWAAASCWTPSAAGRTWRLGRCAWSSEDALERDPLRTLRVARFAAELGFTADPGTEAAVGRHAARLTEAAPERIWAELRHLVCADGVLEGLALAERTGVLAEVLPELVGAAQRGAEPLPPPRRLRPHRRRAGPHCWSSSAIPRAVFGDLGARGSRRCWPRPLADELTRGQALRFAALLHDVGKPATRGERPDGRVTFIGHDATGDEMVHAACRRLRASSRLASFLGAVTRHHLVLGFLVHQRPLSRRDVYRYLRTVDPVEVEVTLFTCADRLATRGRNAPSRRSRPTSSWRAS